MVDLVQRGPFSYDEYTVSSGQVTSRQFTITKAKFDSTIGEVLEVFINGVKLYGDGSFITGSSNPGSGVTLHEFSVNSGGTQLTIVIDDDLATSTGSTVTTLAENDTLLIRRVSNRTAKKVDFAPGSVIRETDLDNANTQVFHVAQEAMDTALQGIVLDTDSKWNGASGGANRKIKNVAAPASNDSDDHVATKGYVDVSTDVPTVAGQISPTNNIATVAGQITPTNNIATVAGKATEIQTVADLEDGTTATNAVTTVAGKANEIVTVAGKATEIQTVADLEDGTTATGAISAVAGKADQIGRLGTADAVADMAILGTTDAVADMNTLGTADVVADMNTLATADVVADMNTLATADIVSDMNTLATSDVVADMNTLATSANVTNMANLGATGVVDDLATLGSGKDGKSVGTAGYDSGTNTNISQINTVATGIADINNYADTYFGTSSSASGPTGTFTAGDLYFSTYNSENKLKVYNGSSWQNATSAVEGVATITEFSPNGTDSHFASSHDVGLQIVWLNGVRLIQGTDYLSVNSGSSTSNMTSGTASHIYFASVPQSGDVLSAMGFGTVTSTAVVPKSGGTFTGNVTLAGDLDMATNKKIKQKGAFMQSSTHQSLALGY